MIFKAMKPEDVRRAIAGHKDILKEAAEENEEIFKRLTCVSCGGNVMAVVHPRTHFKPGAVLPNYVARCRTCAHQFDPITGSPVT